MISMTMREEWVSSITARKTPGLTMKTRSKSDCRTSGWKSIAMERACGVIDVMISHTPYAYALTALLWRVLGQMRTCLTVISCQRLSASAYIVEYPMALARSVTLPNSHRSVPRDAVQQLLS